MEDDAHLALAKPQRAHRAPSPCHGICQPPRFCFSLPAVVLENCCIFFYEGLKTAAELMCSTSPYQTN